MLSDRNQFLKAEIRRLRNVLLDAQRFPADGVAQKVEQSVALAEVLADRLAASQREVEALKMRLCVVAWHARGMRAWRGVRCVTLRGVRGGVGTSTRTLAQDRRVRFHSQC